MRDAHLNRDVDSSARHDRVPQRPQRAGSEALPRDATCTSLTYTTPTRTAHRLCHTKNRSDKYTMVKPEKES